MSDGPRVLIVLTSAHRRGAEVEGTELAQQLNRIGTSTDIVALSPSKTASTVGATAIGSSPLAASTLLALRRRARSADLVIAYGSDTLPACAIALLGTRVPFVYRSIGDPRRWVRGRLHRLRTAVLFRRATRIVALWSAAAETISELYRVKPSRIDVIPNARDGEVFRVPTAAQRAEARVEFGVPDDSVVVAFVGSLTEEKRAPLAVQATLLVDGAHLLVAGDGPERQATELAASGAPERFCFLGALDDVRTVLHAADVVVSTSRTEGMPGALIEAALCGVPIVATDVGAVSVIVAGRGTLIPAEATTADVATAIRQELGFHRDRGPIDVDRFTWPVVVAQWSAIIDQVVSASPRLRHRARPR